MSSQIPEAPPPTDVNNNDNPSPPPWHAAYPAPSTNDPPALSRTEVLQRFQQGKIPGRDFILVDLRRMDHEGGTIHGSINLPAQSLYPNIPTLYDLFSAAGITEVIFYCSSSRGRGPRAAAWFHDHIHRREKTGMTSYVLRDGISGWARDETEMRDEFRALMDGFDERFWSSSSSSSEKKNGMNK